MAPPRVLVTGSTGFLGPYATAALAASFEVVTVARSGGDVTADLADASASSAALAALRPDYVLFLAANARIADCERDPDAARAINAEAPGHMARGFGAKFVYVSTDLVFDGRAAPYRALDGVGPLSAYASTKAEGEERVLQAGGRVVRLPLLFGRDDKGRGASEMVRASVRSGTPVTLFTNEYRTPLHAGDAARALAALLPRTDGARIVHLGGPERVSRWEFGRMLCLANGWPTSTLQPAECQDPLRPRDVSLSSEVAQRPFVEMLREC